MAAVSKIVSQPRILRQLVRLDYQTKSLGCPHVRRFCLSGKKCCFAEESRFQINQEEYDRLMEERHQRGYKGRFLDVIGMIRDDCKLWIQESKEGWEERQSFPIYRDGDHKILWNFSDPTVRSTWLTVCDATRKQGFSTSKLETSDSGFLHFTGCLDVDRLPEDGQVTRTGWASVLSPFKSKSFNRPGYYDWRNFTHITLRIRGDGRTYVLILRTPGYFDVHYHDMFIYSLHTRGGPYWQDVRIPFSKFVKSKKGRLDDRVHRVDQHKINSVVVTLMDNNNGPFSLEIENIGLELDENYREELAYELYYHPKHKLADF